MSLTSCRALWFSCLDSDSAVQIYLTSDILLSNIFTDLAEGLMYNTIFYEVCVSVSIHFKYTFDVNYKQ